MFAEREGFEPPELLHSPGFEAGTLNRSDISPCVQPRSPVIPRPGGTPRQPGQMFPMSVALGNPRAEEEGFEPPELLRSHAFQACALNHSAILPRGDNPPVLFGQHDLRVLTCHTGPSPEEGHGVEPSGVNLARGSSPLRHHDASFLERRLRFRATTVSADISLRCRSPIPYLGRGGPHRVIGTGEGIPPSTSVI